jgi:hypothetical protein
VAGKSWKGAYLDLVVRQRPVVAVRLGLRSPSISTKVNGRECLDAESVPAALLPTSIALNPNAPYVPQDPRAAGCDYLSAS